MGHLLGANNLHLEFPTKVVLDSLTVGINDGDRIGVVGRNGEGKSSLIRLLAGRMAPDSGDVILRGGVRVGMLDQSDLYPADSLVKTVVVGEREEHEWAGDARVRDVITGLLSDVPWSARIGDLSGGQSRRVSLAALLVQDWDVIFLDEPTNHLDVTGVAWLADHLTRRWPVGSGALVVVTHDRWFLDAATEMTWEVHDTTMDIYEGGYAAYILQRVERDRSSQVSEAKRQNLLKKELAWLRRGAPARTSKPKFRIEAANSLIADVPPLRNRIELAKLATARLGKDVIDLLDVSVAYPNARDDRPVLRDVEWRIAPGERSGIVGANGAGKSTLLGLIAGTITPSSGRVKRGKTVRLAMLDQEAGRLSDIEGDLVREVIATLQTGYLVDGKELTPAQLLERLGFRREQLSSRVGELSGGQRRRLQLTLTLLDEPNVLVLDEPTNDVDIDMLAATEDLLDSWPGTLIVVSHDRYLLERITDQQYAVIDGRLRHLPGGVDEYLHITARPEKAEAAPTTTPEQPTGLAGAQLRSAQKEVAALERVLAKLAAKVDAKHVEIAGHDQADHVGIGRLTQQLRDLEGEVRATENRWLEASEVLESDG